MTRWERVRHRAWQVAVVVAGVAAAAYVRDAEPTTEFVTAPFVERVPAGAPARVGGLEVTLLDVGGAAQVAAPPYLRPTAGVWVVVDVRLHAERESTALPYAAIVDAEGFEFRSTDRFSMPIVGLAVEPGIDVTGPIAFEIATDAATPLELHLARSIDQRLDSISAIELAVTPDDLAAWAGDTEPFELGDREVVAP